MVVNLHRHRRMRSDRTGRTWPVGRYRRDWKHVRTSRVLLNGVDVTNQTYYVDTRRGIIRMYLNQDGRPYFDQSTGEAAQVELRGQHVSLRPRKEAA